MRIGLVTCRAYPNLSTSDGLYACALRKRGCQVRALPWNDTPIAAFGGVDALVLRATWDAPDDMSGFERWCREIEALERPVFNLKLACWNNDKRTVLELSRRGIAIPKTVVLADDVPIDAAFSELQCEWAVLKPCWGGSGIGVERARATDSELINSTRERLQRPFMLQEFLPEIGAGELSFIFVRGLFAHAVLKRPAPGEFRVNSQYRGLPPVPASPPLALIREAAAVLDIMDCGMPLYARIDGVMRQERLLCTEIELCDPSLFLNIVPETAAVLADATIDVIVEVTT